MKNKMKTMKNKMKTMKNKIVRQLIEVRQSTPDEVKILGFIEAVRHFKEDEYGYSCWSKELPPDKIFRIGENRVNFNFSDIVMVLDEFFPGFTEWCVLSSIDEEEWLKDEEYLESLGEL